MPIPGLFQHVSIKMISLRFSTNWTSKHLCWETWLKGAQTLMAVAESRPVRNSRWPMTIMTHDLLWVISKHELMVWLGALGIPWRQRIATMRYAIPKHHPPRYSAARPINLEKVRTVFNPHNVWVSNPHMHFNVLQALWSSFNDIQRSYGMLWTCPIYRYFMMIYDDLPIKGGLSLVRYVKLPQGTTHYGSYALFWMRSS
jgi:hypothetical protein